MQAKTDIPTPNILSHSSSGTNPVGTEYLITDHASGVQLSRRWDSMSAEQRVKLIQNLHEKLKTILDLEFAAYGHIYSTDFARESGFDTVPIDHDSCIGPSASSWYHDGSAGNERYYHQVQPNRGPWKTFEDYLNGGIDMSIASIPSETSPAYTMTSRPSWHGAPAELTQLLETLRTTMKTVAHDPKSEAILNASKPVLLNYLPKRHIFVSDSDPTIITDIIDFQDTPIQASFEYASTFLTFLEDPEENPELTQAWMVNTMQYTPELMASMRISQAFFRPIATFDQSWQQGATNLKWSLQELRKEWDTLKLEAVCPIPALSGVEAEKLRQDYIKSEAAIHMRLSLTNALGCRFDGLVPREEWVKTMINLMMVWSRFRDTIADMEVRDGVVMSAEDVRMTWPFDIPSQMGEDLVLVTPRCMSTAIPKLFAEDDNKEKEVKSKEENAKIKQRAKEEKKEKEKSDSKGGLFKSFKKRFS